MPSPEDRTVGTRIVSSWTAQAIFTARLQPAVAGVETKAVESCSR